MKVLTGLDMFTRLEYGKRLLFHRGNLPKGDFLNDVAEIGIAKTTAYRYMCAAKVIAGMPSLDVAKLTMAKLYEIGEELDEEEIKLLESGEVVRDVDKDDIERMGPSELRKALRKERDKRQKQGKKIEELEDRIADITGNQDPKVTPLLKSFLRVGKEIARLRLMAEDAPDELGAVADHDSGITVGDNIYQSLTDMMQGVYNAIKPPRWWKDREPAEAGSSRVAS